MTTNTAFCRGCGQPIRSDAAACPHCGATQVSARSTPTPKKSKITAGVLARLLGGLDGHKFYTGAWGWGIVYIVLCLTFVPGIVALVEAIRYLTLSDAEFQRKAGELNGPFSFLW